MTLAHWRLAAVIAGLVALGCIGLAARSLWSESHTAQQLQRAQTTLTTVRTAHARTDVELDSALGLVAASQRTVDSITVEMRRIRLTPRPVRQLSARVTDTSDQLAVIAALADITAERDTALLDLAAVREQAELIQQQCDALRTASIEHGRAMEAQLRAAQAALAVADSATVVAIQTVHRPWWRRAALGAAGAVKTGAVFGAGILVGRLR